MHHVTWSQLHTYSLSTRWARLSQSSIVLSMQMSHESINPLRIVAIGPEIDFTGSHSRASCWFLPQLEDEYINRLSFNFIFSVQFSRANINCFCVFLHVWLAEKVQSIKRIMYDNNEKVLKYLSNRYIGCLIDHIRIRIFSKIGGWIERANPKFDGQCT